MNKLKSFLALTLVLVSCGGESAPTTGSLDGNQTITWSWYANDIELEIQCAQGWICNENYLGSISHDQPFATMEYVTKLGTIDELNESQTEFFLSDGTLFEEYEWEEGAAIVIKENGYDSYIWFTHLGRSELEEGRQIKCEAYFEDSMTYLELRGDVEEMCKSTRVQ